jgi:L-fuculose-phosphate aldolase
MIDICHSLFQGKLVIGRSGNVSLHLDERTILITSHGVSLGYLKPEELLEMDLEGKIISTLLHLAIYNELSANAVIHAHPTFTTAFYSAGGELKPLTYELTFDLGEVPVVPQDTPTVTDTKPVIQSLKTNNIVVLKNHGVVSIGESLCDAFLLVDMLEEAVKMTSLAKLFSPPSAIERIEEVRERVAEEKYKLFSERHIEAIVKLVNEDEEAQRRGQATGLTARLAIRLDETGQVYNLHFQEGKIVAMERDEQADFLISGSAEYWRMIFNRQLDPFAATTQKKLRLKGDLGRLSKWYSPFTRIFELWRLTSVE